MKSLKTMAVLASLSVLLANSILFAADKPDTKPAKELTCCEQAIAKNQECRHRCCLTAHRKGESCEKCNPNKEDLKALKKKAEAKGQKSAGSGQKPAEPTPKTADRAQKS